MTDVIPIAIREDGVVQIANLPHDLTQEEADKIIRIILAHVMTGDESTDGKPHE